mmetsp:Transcript_22675/g.36448  ORF Transcript_22675/g.36448 Transcript_22675/m.36448 type:complete len:277 (+) Transcript_22675:125-955(+)
MQNGAREHASAGLRSLRRRLTLATHNLQDLRLQLLMVRNRWKLWIFLGHRGGRTIQDALLGGLHHRHVVEGATHGDDAEVQALELLHGLQLLVLDPGDQLVHVAVPVGLHVVAQDHRMSQLVADGQSVLLKPVRDHEGAWHYRLQPFEEVRGSGQHIKFVHDIDDLPELDAMAAQGGCADRHQLGVVRLLRCCHLQLLDPKLCLHSEPRLRCQKARNIATDQPHCSGRLSGTEGRSEGQRPRNDLLVCTQQPPNLDPEIVVVLSTWELWVGLSDRL